MDITFQAIIFRLKEFWAKQDCLVREAYDIEKGAGTFNPDTFLRSLGDKPWRVAYAEPCRRPGDGRYGENPNRMGFYYQFQALLKPSPDNIIDLYLQSLEYIGIDLSKHDIRFVHDDWKSPTLGAWGLGWEVWLDGMEITQFTYFQQVGGITLPSVPAELTYGTERLAMYLQGVEHFKDIQWNETTTYGDLHLDSEWDYSTYSFEVADKDLYFRLFNDFEKEFFRAIEAKAIFSAYDLAMKCSHIFNTLGSLGAISITERESYILRVRALTAKVAEAWVERLETQKVDVAVVCEEKPEVVEIPEEKPMVAKSSQRGKISPYDAILAKRQKIQKLRETLYRFKSDKKLIDEIIKDISAENFPVRIRVPIDKSKKIERQKKRNKRAYYKHTVTKRKPLYFKVPNSSSTKVERLETQKA